GHGPERDLAGVRSSHGGGPATSRLNSTAASHHLHQCRRLGIGSSACSGIRLTRIPGPHRPLPRQRRRGTTPVREGCRGRNLRLLTMLVLVTEERATSLPGTNIGGGTGAGRRKGVLGTSAHPGTAGGATGSPPDA